MFTVITCIILSVSQGVAFRDNSQAISAIGAIIDTRRLNGSLVVLEQGTLRTCSGIPNQRGTDCVDILTFGSKDLQIQGVDNSSRDLEAELSEELNAAIDFVSSRSHDDSESGDGESNDSDLDNGYKIGEAVTGRSNIRERKTDDKNGEETVDGSEALEDNISDSLDDTCITALQWVDDT